MNEPYQAGSVDPKHASEMSIFTLLEPFKMLVNGAIVDIHGVEMRAFGAQDLPLLDQFRGQPVALAQNVVAALCDLTVDQVRQLALVDFTMLADDALWQVSQICIDMGLQADFFLSSGTAIGPPTENLSHLIPHDPG